MGGPRGEPIERLLARTDQSAECWTFQGRVNSAGYAVVMLRDHTLVYGHRLAYEHFIGPIGDAVVHHDCGNRRCVRPDHLRLLSSSAHSSHHHPGGAEECRACGSSEWGRTPKGRRYCKPCARERARRSR
jgi:hypothetical protein